MFWEEKIDYLKRAYTATEFKDPFRGGWKIIHKILNNCFSTTEWKFQSSENRETLIKNYRFIKTTTLKEMYQDEMKKLNDDSWYWLLLINAPFAGSFKVYDCKKRALRTLLAYSSGVANHEFCIVDKKYNWIGYFRLNTKEGTVSIYGMGDAPTIWDNQH